MIEDKKKLDEKRAADMKLQEERKAAKPKVEDSKKRTGTPTAEGVFLTQLFHASWAHNMCRCSEETKA